MNLIILHDDDQCGDKLYRVNDDRAEHIKSILKLDIGGTVEVGLVNGPSGMAKITDIKEGEVILQCENMSQLPPPYPTVDIICALPRPQTLKKVLLTSSTMGVRHLHLIRANRVERSYFQSPLLEEKNMKPYLIEGLSQGKHTRLPKVTIHDRFRKFMEDTLPTIEKAEGKVPVKTLADLDSGETLSDVYGGSEPEWLLLAVGPEGGWVPFEIELMKSLGFRSFTLGRWVLRVENAVTAVLSQLELLRMTRL